MDRLDDADFSAWKKYYAPPDMLENESRAEYLHMGDLQLKSVVSRKIGERIKEIVDDPVNGLTYAALNKVKAKKYTELLVDLEIEVLTESVQNDYVEDFQNWLTGRSPKNNPRITPWGNKKLVHLPGVKEFLDSPLDNRSSVIKKLTKLKLTMPRNIDECWIYYKYIIDKLGISGKVVKEMNYMNVYDYPDSYSLGPLTYVNGDVEHVNLLSVNPDSRYHPGQPSPPQYSDYSAMVARTTIFENVVSILTNQDEYKERMEKLNEMHEAYEKDTEFFGTYYDYTKGLNSLSEAVDKLVETDALYGTLDHGDKENIKSVIRRTLTETRDAGEYINNYQKYYKEYYEPTYGESTVKFTLRYADNHDHAYELVGEGPSELDKYDAAHSMRYTPFQPSLTPVVPLSTVPPMTASRRKNVRKYTPAGGLSDIIPPLGHKNKGARQYEPAAGLAGAVPGIIRNNNKQGGNVQRYDISRLLIPKTPPDTIDINNRPLTDSYFDISKYVNTRARPFNDPEKYRQEVIDEFNYIQSTFSVNPQTLNDDELTELFNEIITDTYDESLTNNLMSLYDEKRYNITNYELLKNNEDEFVRKMDLPDITIDQWKENMIGNKYELDVDKAKAKYLKMIALTEIFSDENIKSKYIQHLTGMRGYPNNVMDMARIAQNVANHRKDIEEINQRYGFNIRNVPTFDIPPLPVLHEVGGYYSVGEMANVGEDGNTVAASNSYLDAHYQSEISEYIDDLTRINTTTRSPEKLSRISHYIDQLKGNDSKKLGNRLFDVVFLHDLKEMRKLGYARHIPRKLKDGMYNMDNYTYRETVDEPFIKTLVLKENAENTLSEEETQKRNRIIDTTTYQINKISPSSDERIKLLEKTKRALDMFVNGNSSIMNIEDAIDETFFSTPEKANTDPSVKKRVKKLLMRAYKTNEALKTKAYNSVYNTIAAEVLSPYSEQSNRNIIKREVDGLVSNNKELSFEKTALHIMSPLINDGIITAEEIEKFGKERIDSTAWEKENERLNRALRLFTITTEDISPDEYAGIDAMVKDKDIVGEEMVHSTIRLADLFSTSGVMLADDINTVAIENAKVLELRNVLTYLKREGSDYIKGFGEKSDREDFLDTRMSQKLEELAAVALLDRFVGPLRDKSFDNIEATHEKMFGGSYESAAVAFDAYYRVLNDILTEKKSPVYKIDNNDSQTVIINTIRENLIKVLNSDYVQHIRTILNANNFQMAGRATGEGIDRNMENYELLKSAISFLHKERTGLKRVLPTYEEFKEKEGNKPGGGGNNTDDDEVLLSASSGEASEEEGGDIGKAGGGNKDDIVIDEENERLEKERLENERLEKERLEREENERIERERERIENERIEKERLEREERERLENERIEKERLEREENERLENERLEKERLEREENERLENERLEKERLEREERERLENERLEKERLEREENERIEREREREEADRKLNEAAERSQKMLLEREKVEKELKEFQEELERKDKERKRMEERRKKIEEDRQKKLKEAMKNYRNVRTRRYNSARSAMKELQKNTGQSVSRIEALYAEIAETERKNREAEAAAKAERDKLLKKKEKEKMEEEERKSAEKLNATLNEIEEYTEKFKILKPYKLTEEEKRRRELEQINLQKEQMLANNEEARKKHEEIFSRDSTNENLLKIISNTGSLYSSKLKDIDDTPDVPHISKKKDVSDAIKEVKKLEKISHDTGLDTDTESEEEKKEEEKKEEESEYNPALPQKIRKTKIFINKSDTEVFKGVDTAFKIAEYTTKKKPTQLSLNSVLDPLAQSDVVELLEKISGAIEGANIEKPSSMSVFAKTASYIAKLSSWFGSPTDAQVKIIEKVVEGGDIPSKTETNRILEEVAKVGILSPIKTAVQAQMRSDSLEEQVVNQKIELEASKEKAKTAVKEKTSMNMNSITTEYVMKMDKATTCKDMLKLYADMVKKLDTKNISISDLPVKQLFTIHNMQATMIEKDRSDIRTRNNLRALAKQIGEFYTNKRKLVDSGAAITIPRTGTTAIKLSENIEPDERRTGLSPRKPPPKKKVMAPRFPTTKPIIVQTAENPVPPPGSKKPAATLPETRRQSTQNPIVTKKR